MAVLKLTVAAIFEKLETVTIEGYTTPDPVVVTPETKVEEVIALFRRHEFRHLPVLKGERVEGIISDRDILLARPMGVSTVIQARDVMSKNPYSVRIDTPLERVAYELSNKKIDSAIVHDRDGKFFGIFTATDALNALVEILRGVPERGENS